MKILTFKVYKQGNKIKKISAVTEEIEKLVSVALKSSLVRVENVEKTVGKIVEEILKTVKTPPKNFAKLQTYSFCRTSV